uniref:Uncharacterized protein n=1 Tax=viral metagenome TaxID=1070528 RepID=A0A6C0H2F1_9ZZZZ
MINMQKSIIYFICLYSASFSAKKPRTGIRFLYSASPDLSEPVPVGLQSM